MSIRGYYQYYVEERCPTVRLGEALDLQRFSCFRYRGGKSYYV